MRIQSIRMFLATTGLECSDPQNSSNCGAVSIAFEELEQKYLGNPDVAGTTWLLTLMDALASPDLVAQMEITSIPTLLFQVDDEYIVARLVGSEITVPNIKAIVDTLFNAAGNGDGVYESNGLEFGEGKELQLGLIGFGSGFDLPNWLWLGLAIFSGYKAATADNNVGLVLWSAGGVGATIKYVNSK